MADNRIAPVDGVWSNEFIRSFRKDARTSAELGKQILRDLNDTRSNIIDNGFGNYNKADIQRALGAPYSNQSILRNAVRYLYVTSPHFYRLIQYFAALTDFSYYVSPYRIDPQKANQKTINYNYRKVLNLFSSMNIKTQCSKMLTVCLREDVFYGTAWVSDDNIVIQQLPSEYCQIASVEDGVPNVTFDFSYFVSKPHLINFFPREFKEKYDEYKRSGSKKKWLELDSPTSFAVKCNTDTLEYAVPPFAGLLREIFDLEDYKLLKLAKTTIDNYAMISMDIPTDDEGHALIEEGKAKEYWSNLDSIVPDEIGTMATPMKLNKISFERSGANQADTIAEAEQNLFTAAGVSSLLFNNEKASSNALLLSIKADQALTYGIVKSIGDALNRILHAQPYGKYWKLTFIDCSPVNRKEVGDQYLKAAQYGLPTVMMYAASQGLGQAEFDSMNFLENDVLGLKEKLIPLRSSATQSSVSDSKGATDEGGAPTKEIGDLSDSRERNQENE